MARELQELVTSLDSEEDVHLARILILLNAFQVADRPAIEGITKLAKLDFLLRYPSAFRKALIARGVPVQRIPVGNNERRTIEARMIRYRYGPWDHRYRRFLNILVARGLVTIRTDGRTIQIDLTERGNILVAQLTERSAFIRIDERANLLKRHLNLGAKRLMEFIYEQFPDLTSLEYNESIGLEDDER